MPAADFREGRRNKSIKGIVLHSTCGRKLGDIETLTSPAGPVVSCHYYVTRNGEVYQFVKDEDTAFHAGVTFSQNWSNSTTIGIEQEHLDGEEDWPNKQIEIVAALIAYLRQTYGNLKVKSHAEIARPKGRKEDPKDYPWHNLSILVASATFHTWEKELR